MNNEYEPYTEPPRRRPWLTFAVGLVAVMAIVGGVSLAGDWLRDRDAAEQVEVRTRLETVEALCAEWSAYVSTGDEGHSLTVRNAGAREVDGADVEDLECVLREIDTPDAVLERIGATRALDGMQDARWDGLEAVWNYHPDDGMTLIVSETQ